MIIIILGLWSKEIPHQKQYSLPLHHHGKSKFLSTLFFPCCQQKPNSTEDFFLLLRILKKKKKATPKSYLIICPSYYITDDGVLKLMYPSSLTHSPTFLPTLHPLSAIHTESPLQLPILHSLLNWTLVSWSLPLQIHLQNDKGATVKATFF